MDGDDGGEEERFGPDAGGEDQRGEKTARTGTDDNRAMSRNVGSSAEKAICHIRRRAYVRIISVPSENFGLIRDFDIKRVDELDRATLACVPAAPMNAEIYELARIDFQARDDGAT